MEAQLSWRGLGQDINTLTLSTHLSPELSYPVGKMFKTKNDAHVYIVAALQHGIFKHCVHLTLDVTGQFRSRPWEPYCAKHNFVRSDRNQFQYCCPDTCCSFEDRRAAERAQRRAKPLEAPRISLEMGLQRGLERWLDWFKSLPAIQASIVLTILLVPILYFSPGWVERIIELYNEVKGK
jgi:hypothetical protein